MGLYLQCWKRMETVNSLISSELIDFNKTKTNPHKMIKIRRFNISQ